MNEPVWTAVADLELSTGRAPVDAFAAAVGGTGGDGRDRVPATYAFTALSRPEVLGVLERMAADRKAVLVHQAQQFSYERDLEVDRSYQVAVDWRCNPDRDDRIVVRGRVRDEAGRHCQEFLADIVLFENRRADEAGS
ncbi:hypothetical protein [Stappia sp.]|uniref:hypothetical protein n=1 Tax=Stappia sp. TaxID=1870903 RepID=UPI003A996758